MIITRISNLNPKYIKVDRDDNQEIITIEIIMIKVIMKIDID